MRVGEPSAVYDAIGRELCREMIRDKFQVAIRDNTAAFVRSAIRSGSIESEALRRGNEGYEAARVIVTSLASCLLSSRSRLDLGSRSTEPGPA
jgi:hypothetical protein